MNGKFLRILALLFILLWPSVSLAEDDPQPDFQPVRGLLEAGKGEEALLMIESLFPTTTKNPEIFYLMTVANLLTVDEQKAADSLQQAVALDKTYRSREGEAYFWAGRVLLREDEKAHIGLHYIDRAITFSPEKKESAALLFKERGISLATDKPWIAHRMLDRATLLIPSMLDDDSFFYNHSIYTITDPRMKIDAVERFTKQFPKSPLLPQVLMQKAETLYMLGEFATAKATFQKIAETYPESSQGKESKERLASWKEFKKVILSVPPDPNSVKTGIIIGKDQQLTIGASGLSFEGHFSQGPAGREKAKGKFTGLPLPSAPPMALIGKIGEDGNWFLVGRGFTGRADRNGELYLMVNRPSENRRDYKGHYPVMVRVE